LDIPDHLLRATLMGVKRSDEYSPEETARRRDDAIRRALNTPPTPHKEMVGKVGRARGKRDARQRSRPVDTGKDKP
jgi:hypothetical protein